MATWLQTLNLGLIVGWCSHSRNTYIFPEYCVGVSNSRNHFRWRYLGSSRDQIIWRCGLWDRVHTCWSKCVERFLRIYTPRRTRCSSPLGLPSRPHDIPCNKTSENTGSAKSCSPRRRALGTAAWTCCSAFCSSLSLSWQPFSHWYMLGQMVFPGVEYTVCLEGLSPTLWDTGVLFAISCSSDWLTWCHFHSGMKWCQEIPKSSGSLQISYDREGETCHRLGVGPHMCTSAPTEWKLLLIVLVGRDGKWCICQVIGCVPCTEVPAKGAAFVPSLSTLVL